MTTETLSFERKLSLGACFVSQALAQYAASYVTWIPETAASYTPLGPFVRTGVQLTVSTAAFCGYVWCARQRGWWPTEKSSEPMQYQDVENAFCNVGREVNHMVPECVKNTVGNAAEDIKNRAVDITQRSVTYMRSLNERRAQHGWMEMARSFWKPKVKKTH